MAKTCCLIERTSFKCAGHDGHGRFNLISGGGKRQVWGKTERQTEAILGEQIMRAYHMFCSRENVSREDDGVELIIEFKKYEKKKRNENED